MIASTLMVLAMQPALASSHREAPTISQDPAADITDFYMFENPNDPSKTVFIMNVNPLELPGGGPNFHRFGDDVRYLINIDNEGDALADVQFEFFFRTFNSDPGNFLYSVGDIADPANVLVTQGYIAKRWENGSVVTVFTNPGSPGFVAPANVGVASDPTMGYTPDTTAPGSITSGHIVTRSTPQGDVRIFAGPRQEGFFVDLERTFDLLNLGNPDNQNTLEGYNVHTIAIEVPTISLTNDGLAPQAGSGNEHIAAWATTERRRNRTLSTTGGLGIQSGAFTQVGRLGNPLVNEAVIGIGDKDRFNAAQPIDDVQFLDYVRFPLLPVFMDALLGIPDPVSHDEGLGFGGREDLILTFLTGHPALGTLPTGFALGGPIPSDPSKSFAAFEALRMNLTLPAGFPNGRRVEDDVVDVALSAMCGLLIPGNGCTASDGVDSTGLSYLTSFPFLGDPWAGDDNPTNPR